jgi:hypothetical protein
MPVKVKHQAKARPQQQKDNRLQQTRGSFCMHAEEQEGAPVKCGE